ncbi:MAG: circadian clock KaiB family protein [Anaerolineae bacterium]
MTTKTLPSAMNDPRENMPFYRLRLFVAGDEPNSLKAKAVLSRLCNERLKERCEIRIVDVFEDYQAAIDYGISVVPALIVESPLPMRTIVGSLNATDKVLAALGLVEKEGDYE